MIPRLEPYCSGFLCTYVDKEGMLQGTDLDWFRRLRATTPLELTAAGGITTLEEVRELAAHERPRRPGHGDLHRQAGSGGVGPDVALNGLSSARAYACGVDTPVDALDHE